MFDDPAANPRAWTYASRLLRVWEAEARDPALLAVALSGVLGEAWALAFLQVYRGTRQPLMPDAIINAYSEHRALVHSWKRDGALDVIAASVERLKRHLQPQSVFDAIRQDATTKNHLETFFADLPADLQREVQRWLDERGFTGLTLSTQACKRGRRVRS